METNPYAAPSSNLFGASSGTGPESVSQGVVTQLQRTKPWVKFLAVLLFIVAGLMIMGGVAGVVGGGMGALGAAGEGAGLAAGAMVGMAIFYALFGLLYLYPAVKMWKYGGRIADLMVSRKTADLEAALNEQRAVWKFWGIVTVIMLIGSVAAVGVAGVAGVMSLRGAAAAAQP